MSGQRLPPRLPARLARWVLSPDDADRLLDALDEEYVRHQSLQRARGGAVLWYWGQVLRSLPPLLGRRWERRRNGRTWGSRRRGASGRGRALLTDLRHLSRTLRRSPWSAGAAVLTLALTLGAGTSIFAVVDAVLLEPPPFEDPEALVALGERHAGEPEATPRTAVGFATFDAWREAAGPQAGLEAFDPTTLTLTELGAAERVSVTDVTPGFLALLGITPALGRLFGPDDTGRPVVIVSHSFWRGKLAGDSTVVGRRIVLGGRAHTVVGVLPERFFFALDPSALWRPLSLAPARAVQDGAPVRVLARLNGAAGPDELTASLEEVSRRASPPARVVAMPLSAAITGDGRGVLQLLAGAAALAIVIAFINLAGLLLLRSVDRRRELAVRRALGAPPSETTRQLLLEALVLVGAGLLGGVLLASWITPTVGRFALEFGGLAQREIGVGWRACGVVGLAAFACASACAAVPGLAGDRSRLAHPFHRGAAPSAEDLGVRRVFVAGEVALAFVLLVSMALLGRSLLDVLAVDPGFDSRGVLKLQVSLPETTYGSPERVTAFQSALRNALGERLGRRAVAMVDEVPLAGGGGGGGVPVRASPTDAPQEAVVRAASPGYFQVLRIPVVAGRAFGERDHDGVPPRVVVSESLVRLLLPPGAPVGRPLWLAGVGQPAEIVGVVGDVKHRSLAEPARPTVYRSALQAPSASAVIVVRAEHPDPAVVATVREEVRRLDGNVPVYRVRSLREVVGASPGVPARRLLTAAFTAFAGLGVVLSALGLFGIAAHEVARRRPELAVRTALGAAPVRILGRTLVSSAWTVGAGLTAGGVLAIGVVRGLADGTVSPGLPEGLGLGAAAAALLVAVAAAAVLPAAVRAARSDPGTALRGE